MLASYSFSSNAEGIPLDVDIKREQQRLENIAREKKIIKDNQYLQKLNEERNKFNEINKKIKQNLKNTSSDAKCFSIDEMLFTEENGDEMPEEFNFLRQVIEEKNLKCVNSKNINQLLHLMYAALYARGYTTTKLGVPDQSLSSKYLKIIVFPGYVRKIYTDSPEIATFLSMLFPSVEGEILNYRQFESTLEQVERLRSFKIEFQIFPVKDQRSLSDVLIRLVSKGEPLSVSATVDNSGTKATGKRLLRTTIAFDNPFGLADHISVNTSSAIDSPKNANRYSAGITYEIPYGNSLTNIGYNYDYSRQRVQDNRIDSVSRNKRSVINWLYNLNRSKTFKSKLGVSYEKKDGKTYLGGEEAISSRKDTSSIALSYKANVFFEKSSLDLKVLSMWGVPWLGAMKNTNKEGEPVYEYNINKLDLTYSATQDIFEIPTQWTSVFSAQYSDDILFAVDQFSIGSRYSVRGFGDEFSLSSEKGFYWRNQISRKLSAEFLAGIDNLNVYTGIDYGRLYGPNTKVIKNDSLSGLFIGAKFGIKNINFDVHLSKGLSSTEDVVDRKTLYMNASYSF